MNIETTGNNDKDAQKYIDNLINTNGMNQNPINDESSLKLPGDDQNEENQNEKKQN